LYAGPIWDYNLAYGNAKYYTGETTEGWQIEYFMFSDYFNIDGALSSMPFWWGNMWQSRRFQNKLYTRWWKWRESCLSTDKIMGIIDSLTVELEEAQHRNFKRWPILDEYVWPNAYIGYSYEDEIDYLKDWCGKRIQWMDEHLTFSPANVERQTETPSGCTLTNYPNPFNSTTTICIEPHTAQFLSLDIYDVNGRLVRHLMDGVSRERKNTLMWDARENSGRKVVSGVYWLRLQSSMGLTFHRLLYLR